MAVNVILATVMKSLIAACRHPITTSFRRYPLNSVRCRVGKKISGIYFANRDRSWRQSHNLNQLPVIRTTALGRIIFFQSVVRMCNKSFRILSSHVLFLDENVVYKSMETLSEIVDGNLLTCRLFPKEIVHKIPIESTHSKIQDIRITTHKSM